MHAKRKLPTQELATLLKDVCEQLLVDAQSIEHAHGTAALDVGRWHELYNAAAALHTRLVRTVGGDT